ncbi:hypothetical protein BCE_2457 [Bacillus cereus ATCC 10987]|uniref:Uncharacterized protein n=1 Tax=Bacillus cereus (strain ATCC 10987 / NRS 248) TaxID=222523 RepID=Q738D8_BACC1|nr:hypothetical protein BCE_2457 [Bacillus cereus ATCC 10987]
MGNLFLYGKYKKESSIFDIIKSPQPNHQKKGTILLCL